jgi:hypothetical protein
MMPEPIGKLAFNALPLASKEGPVGDLPRRHECGEPWNRVGDVDETSAGSEIRSSLGADGAGAATRASYQPGSTKLPGIERRGSSYPVTKATLPVRSSRQSRKASSVTAAMVGN